MAAVASTSDTSSVITDKKEFSKFIFHLWT